MAGLYAPLPTLRSHPRGGLRTDRGRRGLLLLHRSGLSPHTPCRSPGALTRVAACTLARSPIRDPLSEGFRHFVSSMPAPVASGWSESPGGACTHWKAPPFHGAPPLRSLRQPWEERPFERASNWQTHRRFKKNSLGFSNVAHPILPRVRHPAT